MGAVAVRCCHKAQHLDTVVEIVNDDHDRAAGGDIDTLGTIEHLLSNKGRGSAAAPLIGEQ